LGVDSQQTGKMETAEKLEPLLRTLQAVASLPNISFRAFLVFSKRYAD